MRILFVLLGDCAKHEQTVATESHLRLFQHIEDTMGVAVDVFIHTNTYTPCFTKYKYRLMGLKVGCDYYKDTNEAISGGLIAYDYVYFMAIDLILKDKFISSFTLHSDKLVYPFQTWVKCSETENGFVRVGNRLMGIAAKLYPLMFMTCLLCHEGYENAITQGKLHKSDILLLVHTLHASDASEDWNPLYFEAGKERCMTWYSK